MSTAEKTAFDVRVLQTQLMIAALTCGQHDEYNTFIERHQSELSDAHQQITSHFVRIYGAAGEEQRDAYITDLANAQSIDAMHQGPGFCPNIKRFVLQSLTLQNADEISRFVAEGNLTNPYFLVACEPTRGDSFQTRLSELTGRHNEPMRQNGR